MNREGQVFDTPLFTMLVVRSFEGSGGEWWHDVATLRDDSSDPWPGGHVEQYSDRWVEMWERIA